MLQDKVLDECAVTLGRDDGVRDWAVVHEDQGNVAEHRQGKARNGRSETDGSGSRCRLERVARRLAR